jgi:hypothetical protein
VNSCNSVGRWKNYLNKLLNINASDEFREAEINTAKLLIPESKLNEIEITMS